MKLQKIFWGMLMPLAGLMVSCDQDNPEPENLSPVEKLTEIEVIGELVSEDYQGARSSYYYDWNGSYFNEFEYHAYVESIKEDGTSIYAEHGRLPGEYYYWEGERGTFANLAYAPEGVISTGDLAVVDDEVYLVGVNSTFHEERKLYVYQLVDGAFVGRDSVDISVEGTVEEFAMADENGTLLISVVQNALKSYGHSNLRSVYRFHNGALSLLKSYPNETEGATYKVIPFKGEYLEYHQEGRTLSKMDAAGNATVIVKGEELGMDDEVRINTWRAMHFSENLVMIPVDGVRGDTRQVSTLLIYDGERLLRAYMPVFFNGNGVPIHTLFQDGSHYIRYDESSKVMDVYFHGKAWVNYTSIPRVYHYRASLTK